MESNAKKLGRLVVSTGRQKDPIRELVYGPPGVGKTTFAGDSPAPIFLGEDGARGLDVARLERPSRWVEVLDAVDALTVEAHPYKTLVLDTLDVLEALVFKDVVANTRGAKSIEDIPYGRGYAFALDRWDELTAKLETLQAKKGMGVLLLAHAQSRKVPNLMGEDYERFVLKLHEKAAAKLMAWAHSVLFAFYEVEVSKGDRRTRSKAVDGVRWLYAQRGPTFDAKSRHGLPGRFAFSWAEFSKLLSRSPAELEAALRAEAEGKLEEIRDGSSREKASKALAEARGPEALRKVLARIGTTIAEQDEPLEPAPEPSPPAPETVQAPASPPREERSEAREIARPAPKAEAAPETPAPPARAPLPPAPTYTQELGLVVLDAASERLLREGPPGKLLSAWPTVRKALLGSPHANLVIATATAMGLGKVFPVTERAQELVARVAVQVRAANPAPAPPEEAPAVPSVEVLTTRLGGGSGPAALAAQLIERASGPLAEDESEILTASVMEAIKTRLGPEGVDRALEAAGIAEGLEGSLSPLELLGVVMATPDRAGAPLVPAAPTTGA